MALAPVQHHVLIGQRFSRQVDLVLLVLSVAEFG